MGHYGALLLIEYCYGGHFDGEICTAVHVGPHLDKALMKSDDAMGKCQAQSETTGTTRTGAPVERLEYLLDLFGSDNVSLVHYLNVYLMVRKREVYHGLLIRGIFTSILYNILDGDVQQFAVPKHDKVLFVLGEFPKVELDMVVAAKPFNVRRHL